MLKISKSNRLDRVRLKKNELKSEMGYK